MQPAPDDSRDPIVASFARRVAREPNRTVLAAHRHRATLADIDGLARAAAALLDTRPQRAPVGLRAVNGAGFLGGLLACLRSRRPVALLDPRATRDETVRAVAALGLAAVLEAPDAWPKGRDPFRVVPGGAATPLDDGTISVIKLTSGSTGEPRGVGVTSAALLADDAALRATMGIAAGDRLVAMIPFSHSYGLSSLVLPALVAEVDLALAERGVPLEPLRVGAELEATVLPSVPAWIAALLRLSEPPPLPPSIRLVLTAGAPISPLTAAGFRERFGRPIHVFYGASECGGIAYDREGSAGERGTVGEPVAGVEIALEPVAGLEAGNGERVVVRSDAVARTYLPDRDPALGGGQFATRDLAEAEGRELRLVGRLDDLINVRGHKVNPVEVERTIGELDAVEDVVVFGADEGRPSGPIVRAVVACRRGRLAPDAVVEWCRRRLSDHKVPRSVIVVQAIPRTDRGKLDREALARFPAPGGQRARRA